MTNNDVIKILDILNKMAFFGGQRGGRELWFDKPFDIQNEDIDRFNADIAEVINFIKCQQDEIEKVKHGKWNDGECSNCKRVTLHYKPPYCPFCGAKME